MLNMAVLHLQGHPESAQRGQREAEATTGEPTMLLRGAEEGADGGPSLD